MKRAKKEDLLRHQSDELDAACHASLLEIFTENNVIQLPGPDTDAVTTQPASIQITLSDGYLEKDEARFDYLLVLHLVERHDAGDRSRVLVIGPDTMTAFADRAQEGRRTNQLQIWRGSEPIHSIGMVLYRARRNLVSSRLMRVVGKLGSALDYRTDYSGSVKLALTIVRRLQTLNLCSGVERLLGGVHELEDAGERTQFFAFLADGSKSDDARQLWIKENQLHIGRSLEIAIPWRYGNYCVMRVGPESEDQGATRSIVALRSQYALTAGALGKDEDKSVVHRQLEKEAQLRKRRELTYRYGRENLKRLPLVTPIALEIGANLIQLIVSGDDDLSPEFQELIDMMKDGLHFELGHERLPGIRVRGNETDLPDGTYIIMLFEIPMVSGNISLDQVLVNDTVDRLTLLNIKGEEAVNPANGSECAWIPLEYADIAEQAGLTTWDARGYIVLHLSSVLRKNFSDFINLQNVVNQIRDRAENKLQDITAATGGVARFTNALKTLAEEEVRLKELDEICTRYLSLVSDGKPLHEIIEQLRLIEDLRNNLPANKGEHQASVVYLLAEDIVDLIRGGICEDGDTARLILEPEPTQEILTAVRNEVGNLPPTAQNPVVCVEDPKIRRYFRCLVELEFPHLAVMAEHEFMKPLQPIARIGLE